MVSLVALPFQKVYENCHIASVIIFQHVMFIVMFVVQNQQIKNQAFFMVPLQPMMNVCY
jgi:hypothetical protein